LLSNLILELDVTPLYDPKSLDGVNQLLIEQTTSEMVGKTADDYDYYGNDKSYTKYNKEELEKLKFPEFSEEKKTFVKKTKERWEPKF
jgi:hypothetical protein